MKDEVRVRFAPSPTGPLHLGGVRTALYNFLFAKKNNGKLILRIEDTDSGRYVPGAEEYIIESLAWCGITFDEDIVKGGRYSPYRQSDRKDIYKQYALRLVETGNAYYAFDSPSELEERRKLYESEKKTFIYNCEERKLLKNSLTLDIKETERLLQSGSPYVIRFLVPENNTVTANDLIRGIVSFETKNLDDKVLFKSDGMPTYHLANVVDDYLMKISHVIRGEEWLPSLPLHILLYKAFGWDNEMPMFAHLPLILRPDGKGKLSKRDGDRLGFPVFPCEWKNPDGEIYKGFRESGYFPEAFINMLALLGWNPGTEQEIFSLEELCKLFSLEKVGKAGSQFSPDKAKWFNQQYLRTKNCSDIANELVTLLEKQGITSNQNFVINVCEILKERAVFVSDFLKEGMFFFREPESYDSQAVKKFWKPETPAVMNELKQALLAVKDFTEHNIETEIKVFIENRNVGFGAVMTPFRIAVVGKPAGPSMFLVAEMLGKNEIIRRIDNALSRIEMD